MHTVAVASTPGGSKVHPQDTPLPRYPTPGIPYLPLDMLPNTLPLDILLSPNILPPLDTLPLPCIPYWKGHGTRDNPIEGTW